ncbi:MAG: CBS domain-containing protein [Gammaproteobacteria bacterium]
MSTRTVKDVLEGQLLNHVDSKHTVTDVASLMKKQGIGAVMVLEDNHLVGIFTERDALFRVAAEGLDPKSTKVEEVMTREPVTIAADKAFSDALEKMHAGQFRHVPVLDGETPIGMVSSRDAMGPELEQFMYTKILEEETNDALA